MKCLILALWKFNVFLIEKENFANFWWKKTQNIFLYETFHD